MNFWGNIRMSNLVEIKLKNHQNSQKPKKVMCQMYIVRSTKECPKRLMISKTSNNFFFIFIRQKMYSL